MILYGPWDIMNAISLMWIFLLASYVIGRRIHWSVGMAFCFCLGSAVFVASNLVYADTLKIEMVYMFQQYSTYALMLGCICYVCAEGIKDQMRALRIAARINVLNALIMVVRFAIVRDGFYTGGLLGNSSMNGCFVALTLPFLTNPLAILISLLAILASRATVPIVVLGAVFFGQLLTRKKLGKASYAAVVAFIIGLIVTPQLMNDSGRFSEWKMSFEYWKLKCSYVWGAGAGTYYLHGTLISELRGLQLYEIWTFMHNDWLQIGFEAGLLGLFSCIIMVGYMLYYSRGRPALFSSILGLSAFGMFNMPMRYLPSAFVAALLVRAAFKERMDASAAVRV